MGTCVGGSRKNESNAADVDNKTEIKQKEVDKGANSTQANSMEIKAQNVNTTNVVSALD